MKEAKPKYQVGDLLVIEYEDKSTSIMPVDSITKDEYGRYVYHHQVTDNCFALLYEDDVKRRIKPDTKKYEEYQLYLKLKKKYG